MPKQIVVTVSEFEADTPEQAEQETRSILGRYEGKQFVYAASSLDTLPHPQQVSEISEYFG